MFQFIKIEKYIFDLNHMVNTGTDFLRFLAIHSYAKQPNISPSPIVVKLIV